MATIKAPFNFVPLSEKVFFPDWADQISHDIPFKDGESGTIKLKITAETPIFVRNGHTKEEAEKQTESYKSFSNINGRYFIPATSIKGAIRNVLEIMSFGKMTQVENDSFGLRDLNNESYRNKMKKVHCGWLQLDGDNAVLFDCGEPKRLSIQEIDKQLKTKLYSFITNPNNFRKGEGRNAMLKYKELFTALTSIQKNDKEFNKKFLSSRDYLVEGTFEGKTGTIILTGQPGVREYKEDKRNPFTEEMGMWVGKEKEFIFPYTENVPITVPKKVFDAFKSIHKNTPDFAEFWNKKLIRGEEIPVFFQYESDNVIHSIGLSYLYKFPYKKSVFDGIGDSLKNPDNKQKQPKLDLCECIFGNTYDRSLKGRIQFCHAMGTKNIIPETKETISVSSSPHSSYYPLYLGLNENNQFQNWDNVKRIAGRKRYPVRNKIISNSGTGNMETPMFLLKSGAEFTSKIHFHNLCPLEIGAILTSLTLHNNNCYHNIGYGKPLGYGKIKLEAHLSGALKGKETEYMTIFEKKMDAFLEEEWKNTPQIKELIAMTKGISAEKEDVFTYMKMSTNPKENEFKTGKSNYDKKKEYLLKYSEIISNTPLFPIDHISIKNNPKSFLIEDLEKKAGFRLTTGNNYRCFLNENDMICIFDNTDRSNKEKIRCKYEISKYSKINKYSIGDMVEIKIDEIYETVEDGIDISITKIYPKRN